VRKITETKVREKVETCGEGKKKQLKQLWNNVLAKDTALLESTKTSQIMRSKYKKITIIFLKDKIR